MKVKFLFPLIAVSIICLLMSASWLLWMGYLNSRSTTLEVRIAADVYEVMFYDAANPQHPVAGLTSNGEESLAQVVLRNTSNRSILHQGAPSKYYFVARAGEKTYRSSSICCQVTARHQRINLTIRGLNDWEIREP